MTKLELRGEKQMNSSIDAKETCCPLYQAKINETKEHLVPLTQSDRVPDGAGAVSRKGQELEQNRPQIWARLWLSFVGEEDRGVDV